MTCIRCLSFATPYGGELGNIGGPSKIHLHSHRVDVGIALPHRDVVEESVDVLELPLEVAIQMPIEAGR